MFDLTKLTRADIQSSAQKWNDYIAEVKEPEYRKAYENSFTNYSPKADILQKIRSALDSTNLSVQIIAFGARWCHDCHDQMPRLAKIEQIFGDARLSVKLIGGIMVKIPALRKAGEPIWKSPPSPPESVDPKFDMMHIPTAYIFDQTGSCIGRIVEKPTKGSLEEDILNIITKK